MSELVKPQTLDKQVSGYEQRTAQFIHATQPGEPSSSSSLRPPPYTATVAQLDAGKEPGEPFPSSSLRPPAYETIASRNDFMSEPSYNELHNDPYIWTQSQCVPLMGQNQQVTESVVLVPLSVMDQLLSGGQLHSQQGTTQQSGHRVINEIHDAPSQRESYCVHMIFSCSIFWCCGISGWIFGFAAFILAVTASEKTANGKYRQAQKLGKACIICCIIGAFLGAILTTIVIVVNKYR